MFLSTICVFKPSQQQGRCSEKTLKRYLEVCKPPQKPKLKPPFLLESNILIRTIILSHFKVFEGHLPCCNYCPSVLKSLYSMLSTMACHEASIIFSETPTVPHFSCSSPDSIRTRTFEEVPLPAVRTRTL